MRCTSRRLCGGTVPGPQETKRPVRKSCTSPSRSGRRKRRLVASKLLARISRSPASQTGASQSPGARRIVVNASWSASPKAMRSSRTTSRPSTRKCFSKAKALRRVKLFPVALSSSTPTPAAPSPTGSAESSTHQEMPRKGPPSACSPSNSSPTRKTVSVSSTVRPIIVVVVDMATRSPSTCNFSARFARTAMARTMEGTSNASRSVSKPWVSTLVHSPAKLGSSS
mmetsp:Transcript_97909/g.282460  ORF Transcript_97909/g.282460 Transcript_97909/m.282460 type:complete len:226 (+) Transcript_97909:1333-2010(+)